MLQKPYNSYQQPMVYTCSKMKNFNVAKKQGSVKGIQLYLGNTMKHMKQRAENKALQSF